MANNSLYNSSLANLYRSIGLKRGISPAFINASIAQGIAESSLNPNAIGDNGQARGLHQWHGPRQAGVDFANPTSQINHWYDENKANWGITDPVKANAAAIASERPAGWKPGDPTGVPSYNKRLGDTLALMRFQGYQQDPQDPKSFMALGSDGMPAANTEQPQGAQNAGTGVPQIISLGSEEQQPFNNIGSTLANVGASIASLDNRGTGIASLNASRVASNLQQQEALRERENGWKYAGQTQNGQGLIFQNSKGEMRVEPLSGQFAGQKEPETIRTLRMLQADPSLMDTMKQKSGQEKLEPSLTPETQRMYAMRAIKGDNGWTKEIGGDKQGSVDKRAIDEQITSVANELHMSPDDMMKARTEQRYRNKVADRIALIDVNTETASNKIEAAATNLIETSKKYPRGDIRFLEGIKQKWDEQTNDPNLQALKTAVDAFALDYATALNPQKTSPTVDDVRNARNKILTTMNQESLEAAVGIVQREIGSIRQNARRTHEQWFGSSEEPAVTGGKKTIRDTEGSQPKRLKYNPTTGELE